MGKKGMLAENKTLVKGIVAALIALGLILLLIAQLGGFVSAASYPAGEVKKVQTEIPDFVAGDVLSRRIMCPTVGYNVAVTEATEIRSNVLVMNEGGVCYVIMEGTQSIEEMCRTTLPDMSVSSIIGFDKTVKVKKVDTGYVYSYGGSYCTSSIKVQQTTGKETYYAVCYEIDLGSINRLFFYGVTSQKENLDTAEDFLLDLITSLEEEAIDVADKEEDKEEEKEENKEVENAPEEGVSVIPSGESVIPDFQEEASKLTTEDYYLVANVYTSDWGYEDTVFFIAWENSDVEPLELIVTGPNGQVGVLNEEFCFPGHLMYEFGTTTEGKYILEGKSKEKLQVWNAGATSREHYMELFWSWMVEEEPIYIERSDED